jgi:formylglycine-generating enzyme required for sulfatase activity
MQNSLKTALITLSFTVSMAVADGYVLIAFPPVVKGNSSDKVFAIRCAKEFYDRAKVSQSFDSTALIESRVLGDSLGSCGDSIQCYGTIAANHGANPALFTRVERVGSRIKVHMSWLDMSNGKFQGSATLEGTNLAEMGKQLRSTAEVVVSKAIGIWPSNLQPPPAASDFPQAELVPGGTLHRRFPIQKGDTATDGRTFGFTPFKMTKTEVTWRQYQLCVASGACLPAHYRDGTCTSVWDNGAWLPTRIAEPESGSDLPVVCVDWIQARDYCAWVGGDLPTQMQWEYAARAGDSAAQPWSTSDEVCRQANVRDLKYIEKRSGWDAAFQCDDGYTGPAPAGRFPPNKFGLQDMIGNVRVWVRDVSNPWFFAKADSLNPRFEIRTNSWRYQVGTSYSSPRPYGIEYGFREVGWAGSSSTAAGFRCVQAVP